MLHLYHSNRLERLFDALAILTDRPLADPFAAEVVVAQNPGMARWLAMQLAHRHGIAANLDFPLPANFVWRLYRAHFQSLPEQHPYERQVLAWRILDVLDALLPLPEFTPLAHYLGDERGAHDERRRHQLAGRIADLFDQYMVYRPDWIVAWEEGRAQAGWQSLLWRALMPAEAPHRARLLLQFGAALARGEVSPERLPERVAIFGIAALPPAYLQLFDQLARHCEVHLFVLNPCWSFWSEITPAADQARLRQRWQTSGLQPELDYFQQGNPLLASLGKLGRDYQRLLHAHTTEDFELYDPPESSALLAELQRDILELRARGEAAEPPHTLTHIDRSVQLHACHTPMREVQVLHDQLLSMFETLPGLTPADVVVMTPNIDTYAPYIEAHFASAAEDQRIPFSIADRSSQAELPMVQLFLQLLDLPRMRLTQSEVLGLLEVSALRRRFGLDADAVERLRQWLHGAGVRWGVDAAQRQAEGEAGGARFSWRYGLDRLLLGYAMAPDAELFQGIAPYTDVEGGEAVLIGALHSLIDHLVRLRTRLRADHTPAQWQGLLNQLLDELLVVEEAEYPILQFIRDAIEQWAEAARLAAFTTPIGMTPVRDALRGALTASYATQRFLTGQVTFCAMVPMRSLPFRVVCLLGMNDGEFPRVVHPLGFDLMAQQPRPGDRSRREDDRYLFLEALLSARDQLYISYLGRGVRDNAERLPSLVVSELLDYLEQGYRAPDGEPLRDQLITVHPLQPFSPRYFVGEPGLFSYAQPWRHAARALVGPKTAASPFLDHPLDPPETGYDVVQLSDLLALLCHPLRHFLTRRLAIPLAVAGLECEDHEPFALDRDDQRRVRQRLLQEALAGHDLGQREPIYHAAGVLAEGAFGHLDYAAEAASAAEFAARLTPYQTGLVEPVELDFTHQGLRLVGWIDQVSVSGILTWRRAKLSYADLMGLWLRHLALTVARRDGCLSLHLDEQGEFTLAPMAVEEAQALLGGLLERWQAAQRTPLPIPPYSAWVYCEARWLKQAEPDEALKRAVQRWVGTEHQVGEANYPEAWRLYRGQFPEPADFVSTLEGLVAPLFVHRGGA